MVRLKLDYNRTGSYISCSRAVRVPSSTCTNRLLLAALDWKPEDPGTTQEDVKKTPGKMLPSIISKHCMCTILIFVL